MDIELESGVVNEQEEAAPAAETTPEENPEAVQEENPTEPAKQELSDNERWKIARKRAEEEAQRKMDAWTQKQNSEVARRFAGMTIPGTNRPIATMEDYWEALDAQRSREIEQRIASGTVNPEDLKEMMQRQVDEALRQHDTAIQQEMARRSAIEQGERMLQEQMSEIAKLDPGIKELADLRNMPEFPEFDRLVRAGADLVSAYKAATYGRARQGAAAAAKQATINSVKGTGHLSPVGGTSHPEDSLTDEEMETWKRYGFSASEAQKYHKIFST